MNRDFAEMLSALSEAGAEFLIVGAHALAAHGLPRAARRTSPTWRPWMATSRLHLARPNERYPCPAALPFD